MTNQKSAGNNFRLIVLFDPKKNYKNKMTDNLQGLI
jgi:hypothetical protein